ncbi:hypothetical protein SBA4_490012 [Candidatus Sulfopaludibacter sp. SbA4]|nr:hypothetical protein SBA4_490012 [Candidatus Sulfopaludibacter sp. SbA4]
MRRPRPSPWFSTGNGPPLASTRGQKVRNFQACKYVYLTQVDVCSVSAGRHVREIS